MTRSPLGTRSVILWALVALSSACSEQPQEQPALRTTLIDPREKVAPRHGPPPPRLVAERQRPGLTVLKDDRCTARLCDTEPLIARLKKALPGLEVTIHDWSTPRGKMLLAAHGLRFLPAYILDEAATRRPGFKAIAPHLRQTPRGSGRYLQVGASFDPRAEVCDNGKDDTGNGRVDCEDPDCAGMVVCRPEIPRRLELFVMSQCPHGIKALNAMSEVLAALGSRIDFRVHYIAEAASDGFRSLHGQPEVDEDIRALCAMRHFGRDNRYMEYIWCRNRQMQRPWQSCAGRKGISEVVLRRCATGAEGKALLRADLEHARALGITSSPTWLANNRFVFHGTTPEAIRRGFCKRNKDLPGCGEMQVSTQ